MTNKSIIRLRFHGASAGNHSAYIRIKISEWLDNAFNSSENIIVVPLEFEIMHKHGIYAESPLVDFGRLSNEDKSLYRRKINFRNSHQSNKYEILNYNLSSERGLNFELDNEDNGILTLDPEVFEQTTILNERLRLRSAFKHNASDLQEYELQIRAEIYKGSLRINRNSTLFITEMESYNPQEQRTLSITNDFDVPVTLLFQLQDLSEDIFKIQFHSLMENNKQMLIQPGETYDVLRIQPLRTDILKYSTLLKIYSNITDFEVPLVICPGKLHVATTTNRFLQQSSLGNYSVQLDLGVIPMAELSQSGFIILRNDNPVPIKLSTWDFHIPNNVYFHTTFLGCLRQDLRQDLQQNSSSVALESTNFKICSHLKPHDVAAYEISIQSNTNTTKQMEGSLKILTSYETISSFVKFTTWVGKLEVDQNQLYFKNCFPVRNTFLI